jgi:hypothetical protein
MNFAKKTMSFALASVMVASSLLTGTSALAAEKKVITPMTGTSQAIVATVKDNQVNGNSYYSFTPATTGYYAVALASTPIYKSTDGTYSANYTTGAERADNASVSISKSYNATTDEFNENVAYVSAPQSYSIDWTQAESSEPVETKGYYDALETVELTGGHTYYISAYTRSNSNWVNGSENYITGRATLTITPSDWNVNVYNKTVSKKSFNSYGDRDITTPVASVSYVGAAKDVVVPNFVNNTIPVENFNGSYNEKITSLTLSPNVKSVDGLSDIKTLASVNLANVEKIESEAFSGCSALNNVVIPASVKTIGSSSFSGCSALSSVAFNEGVKKIGSYAFYNTALKAAVLPASVVSIGDHAFGYVENFNTNTVDPYDTTDVLADGFVMGGKSVEAANYAAINGIAYYDMTNGCPHAYVVTTVPATVFAKGKKISTCPLCGNTITKSIKKKTFKISSLKAAKKALTVKAAAQAEMKGYQVQYSTSKKFTKKTTKTVKVATKKKLNKKIKGLKSGKKYYVRVRAYKMNGKKTVYSAWTAKKSVKVK